MCRNIMTLYNLEPPASEDEIRAAATQYVRKVSGFPRPSVANRDVFDRAVADVTAATSALLANLVTSAPARDRQVAAAKARDRAARRFSAPRAMLDPPQREGTA